MTKEALDQNHQTSGQTSIEPDNLPIRSITLALVALIAIVVGTIIVVRHLYWFTSSKMVQTNELDVPNKLLSELNAADKDQLNNFDVIDQQKGVFRLPIDEAMKLYVKKNGN